MKDNFSSQSEGYALYRPQYPAGLFEFISDHVSEKKLAWDCATGNGQSAKELCKYFEKVYATDISQKQLDHAEVRDNILYAKEPAEKISLKNNSVNLVTVAQALHWLDTEAFYKEVKRVGTQGSIIAVWLYHLISVNPEIDALMHEYHFELLGKYYDAERKHVDDGYVNIPFPFRRIDCPGFEIRYEWSIEDLKGYLDTSSAVQKYISIHKESPVPPFVESVRRLWPQGAKLPVRFPVHLNMGYVH